jgi:hypothetical protein
MGNRFTQLLGLPLFLKIIAIFLLVTGLLTIVHFTARPGNLLVGSGAIALGVGVLLRKKWAWYLTLGTAILELFSACAVCFILYTVREGGSWSAESRPVWLALSAAFNFVYGGFVLYYLTRPRIRALFGIYSTKTSS